MLIKNNDVYVYTYPRWYWMINYLLCIPVGAFIGLLIYLYATKPLFTFASFIFSLLLFSAIFYGILWATNRYKKLCADVIVTDDGITATVISETKRKIKTDVFTKWTDITHKEYFGPGDWDARTVVPMTAGFRLFVPGGRILIFGRLVWRQAGFDQVVSLINERT